MKVRVIKSRSPEDGYFDISEYIGQVFEVLDTETDKDIGIYIRCDRDPMGYFIFHDEYEVVEEGTDG